MTQGFKNLNKKFSARSQRFQQEFQHLKDPENAFGVRFTAVPMGDKIRLGHLFCCGMIAEKLKEPECSVFVQKGDTNKRILKGMHFFPSFRWWSIASGARQTYPTGGTKFSVHSYRELYRDGLVEIGFVSDFHDPDCDGNLSLLSDLPIVVFANLVVWVDRIRNQVSASTTEYFIEMEICVKGSCVIVKNGRTPAIFAIRSGKVFNPRTVEFLRYPLGNPDEIPKLIASFYHSFQNLFDKYGDDEEAIFTIED